MESDLCVVIPNFNYGRYLEEAVASVLAQSAVPAQIIVTDDGSTDDSASVIERLSPQWSSNSVSVRLFAHRGLVPTLNSVLPEVRTRFVTVLAADDRWHPELAAAAVEALSAVPEASLWHCDSAMIDSRGEHLGTDGGERRTPAQGPCLVDLLEGRAVVKGAYVLPVALLRAVGGFDPRFPNEDWALFLRAASRGPFLFDRRRLVDRRIHGANWSTAVWSQRGSGDPSRYSAPEVMREVAPSPEVYRRALAFHLAVPVRHALHAGHFAQGFALLRHLSARYPEARGPLFSAALKGIAGAAWRAGPKRILPRRLHDAVRSRVGSQL